MLTSSAEGPRGLPWPAPALLAWALAWGAYALLQQALPAGVAFVAAGAAAAVLASRQPRRWRRWLAASGFPLSALALSGAWTLPTWCWLAAAVVLALAYPLRAWRDAPFFPTAPGALRGIERTVTLAPRASILDAGCGAGHGLQALAQAWPAVRLCGIEWSRPLAWLAKLRVPQADISRGDMWAASWAAHDLVYVFQRPESMPRVWAKARAELRGGSFLVSLEFAVPGVVPLACLGGRRRRQVWIYRIDPRRAPAP